MVDRSNPQPLVSVIVTTRNRLTLLLRAVQSVDAQDYPNREILVLDDASEDGTSDYIRSHYPGVRLFRFDENRGLIVARNLLKMEAKGDYIVSLDDDAYFVNKDAISKVVERMQRESELAVVTFHYLPKPLVDGDGALDRGAQEHYTNFFWGYGHCIRRDAFESVGDYRGFFFHQGEEDDLAIRLLDAGYRLLYSYNAVVVHERSPVARDDRRIAVYAARNSLLRSWLNDPFPWLLVASLNTIVKSILFGVTQGTVRYVLQGLWRACRDFPRFASLRKPVSFRTIRLDLFLRRADVASVDEIRRCYGSPPSLLKCLAAFRSSRSSRRHLWAQSI